MGKILILGSGYAIPEEGHENTHLFVQQSEHGILIDCGGNPLPHFKKAGLDLDSITDIVLTHFHPDHAAGLPLLLMGMWLLGRKQAIHLYGLPHTIDRAESLMKMFDYKKWPGFFPLFFQKLSEEDQALFINSSTLKVYSSPVRHLIPTIGLRFEFFPQEKAVAYSCDTEPCQAVIDLAKDVDLLIHEAAGGSVGHTSPSQAGDAAKDASAKKLLLIHYAASKGPQVLADARQVFRGPVELAQDFQQIEI